MPHGASPEVRRPLPEFIPPELATLTDRARTGKVDGNRTEDGLKVKYLKSAAALFLASTGRSVRRGESSLTRPWHGEPN